MTLILSTRTPFSCSHKLYYSTKYSIWISIVNDQISPGLNGLWIVDSFIFLLDDNYVHSQMMSFMAEKDKKVPPIEDTDDEMVVYKREKNMVV